MVKVLDRYEVEWLILCRITDVVLEQGSHLINPGNITSHLIWVILLVTKATKPAAFTWCWRIGKAGVWHPGLPGVICHFDTALLYPRFNPWDIILGELLLSHAFASRLCFYSLMEWVHRLQWSTDHLAGAALIAAVVVGTSTGGRDQRWGVTGLESTNWVWVPRWFWWWSVLFESLEVAFLAWSDWPLRCSVAK
jgi:hypothetical protein